MRVKVTNRLGLPEAIVHAVSNDPYDSGEGTSYSITGLLKPPRMAVLSKDAEVVEDAADRIYALQGQVMHHILERAGKDLEEQGYVVEKRFYKTYKVDGAIYRISGQIDLFDPATGLLSDYKYTSVGSAKRGLKEEHRLQLNVQARLLQEAGFEVKGAEVVLLLRDWSAMRIYEGYPESPALKQVVEFMPSEEVDKWVVERIRLHEAAKKELPECSMEERWNRPTYAVMKTPTAGRATRVFDTKVEAETFLTTDKGKGQSIVERPGLSIRCLRYCPVRSVCEVGKKLQEEASAPVVDADGFVKV